MVALFGMEGIERIQRVEIVVFERHFRVRIVVGIEVGLDIEMRQDVLLEISVLTISTRRFKGHGWR